MPATDGMSSIVAGQDSVMWVGAGLDQSMQQAVATGPLGWFVDCNEEREAPEWYEERTKW